MQCPCRRLLLRVALCGLFAAHGARAGSWLGSSRTWGAARARYDGDSELAQLAHRWVMMCHVMNPTRFKTLRARDCPHASASLPAKWKAPRETGSP